jgi:hypothetical protein
VFVFSQFAREVLIIVGVAHIMMNGVLLLNEFMIWRSCKSKFMALFIALAFLQMGIFSPVRPKAVGFLNPTLTSEKVVMVNQNHNS